MTALVFLDTETTGLSLDDDIWEFAAIRREPDGTESELHLFLEHSPTKCARLPESFRLDHERRFPAMTHDGKWHPDVSKRHNAAELIDEFLQGRPHIVGAVPNFDTERIARLCSEWFEEWSAPWHYHLIDVENLAVGYLAGLRAAGAGENGHDADLPSLPWKSDDLSLAVGIEPPTAERHTAMGDARWAMRLYDRITGGVA